MTSPINRRKSQASLAKRIMQGYLLIVLLVIVTGLVGHWGISRVAHSLYVVRHEEAPVVEMANEMKVSTGRALKASSDYRTATMVFSTESANSVTASKAEYLSTVSDFDD